MPCERGGADIKTPPEAKRAAKEVYWRLGSCKRFHAQAVHLKNKNSDFHELQRCSTHGAAMMTRHHQTVTRGGAAAAARAQLS
jgi:hypothetical protein